MPITRTITTTTELTEYLSDTKLSEILLAWYKLQVPAWASAELQLQFDIRDDDLYGVTIQAKLEVIKTEELPQ